MFYRMYDEKKGNNKNGEALNSQGIFRPAVNFIGVRRKLTQVTAFVLSFLLLFTSIDITAFASEVEVSQEISAQSETGGEAAPAATETTADSSAGSGSEGQTQGGSTDATGQGEGTGTSGDAGTTGGAGTTEGTGATEGTGTTENPGSENPGTGSSTEAGSAEGGSTGENPGETKEEPDEETTEDELGEEETEEELEDEEDEEEEETKVAFRQSLVENGIEIMVSAPEGVFPEGASLRVKTITRENDVAEIEQLLAEEKDAATDENTLVEVEQSYSFDITIADKNGNEIEPDTMYGDVSVTFKNVGVAEVEQTDEKELSVYYVSDDYSQAEEIDHETNVSEDAAVITAEHFSIYTVVITSGTLKDSILHYYQGSSIANSYFTIYNEEQLLKYRQLVNGWVAGSVKDDSFSTILVNSDDANPVEGITGEGQATDMKVKDLNMSAKLMDDVTVTSEWSTPITKLCKNHSFDGKGHTITFKKLNSSLISKFNAGDANDGDANYVFIGSDNNGTIKNLTLKYLSNTYKYLSDEEEETKYATITVRVDGEKAEIGEAITGAEALAASADGENYITLERDDDLAVYSTELENLYPVNEETGEVDDETKELVYNVYYVYEDENETISAAQFTYEDYEAELNYVSVTYNLEGANTYKEESDGSLSEDVMAAVRVDVNEGKYEAQEDYDAVVMAADGYEIPTKEYHVVVKIGGANGTELTRGTDYKYTYSSSTKRGKIHINKEKITDSVYVEVSADVLADKPANKIILKTRGGTITDALWEKDADGQYSQTVYAGSDSTALPTSVTPYKGSDSIKFAGWYQDMAGTGTKYTSHSFVSTEDGNTKEIIYYAKWVLAKTTSNNGTVQYYYKGNVNVSGADANGAGQVTYGNNGFTHAYKVGDLTSAQINGTSSSDNSSISMVSSVGQDIFTNIKDTNIWVAMICTLDSNGLVDITYLFENRGSSSYTSKLYFGLYADVMIACDDYATIASTTTTGGVSYMTMTSRTDTTYAGQEFRLYTAGTSFGIDNVYSYWYGYYGYNANHVFNNEDRVKSGVDSGLAFSWYVNDIPAKGYVTRTTKMGMAEASKMSNIVANLHAESGAFSTGTSNLSITSDKKSITVNANGSITASTSSGTKTYAAPTRSGYVFSHWSIGSQNSTSVAGKTYDESVELYANWTPKPDKSVTNNSSIQKVNGSDNLLVPSALGKIVIENKTAGASTGQTIDQGATAANAAGYASGFDCTLKIDGADDRYLLPDDVEVTVTKSDGTKITLTKDTGYTYTVYDNRKKADLSLVKQYIQGDVTVTAVGYELPPVTATSVTVKATNNSISYGQTAEFKASAETSKNHVASYQWYIAPYYEMTLDNVTYWTYQNQDGTALKNGNGTYTFTHGSSSKNVSIKVTGANKATLRITGLDVDTFSSKSGESTDGLRFKGYHVYCVVTSTRNITGQEIVAVSSVAEVQVTKATYAAPTGLVGSATSYNGSSDGKIVIESQSDRSTMWYKKTTDTDQQWQKVTDDQLAAGMIKNLSSGTYQFKYIADSNHAESAATEVTVSSGRNIRVTYKSSGADDENLRTQYKYVKYGTTVTADSTDVSDASNTIKTPERKGYTFTGWSPGSISSISKDIVVTAQYTPSVYTITLDNQDADTAGTAAIFEKYSVGFYKENSCTNALTGQTGISIPEKDGYIFLGYYSASEDGTQLIAADGCLTGDMLATNYLANATLYAHWQKIESKYEEPDPEEETTYTITYKDVDGTAAGAEFSGQFMDYAPQYGSTGTAVTLPTAVKTGYSFAGWFKKAKGTGSAITEIPETNEDDITVYAKWNSKRYNITLVTNGGSYTDGYSPAVQYKHGGENVALPTENDISRENYTFLGWFDNANLTGDPVTEVDASAVNDKTYYAGWEKLAAYEITLTGDGKDGSIYELAGVDGYGFIESGKIYVYAGKEYKFTVKTASAYRVTAVMANGQFVTGDDDTYTLSSVNDDTTITVVTEKLVSTEEEEDAVATILLADGTTGRFKTLAAAISYAANYGTSSVIKLEKDLGGEHEYGSDITAIAGRAYTIDFNGHTVTDGSLLIEDGASVTLTDSVNDTTASKVDLSVENRGSLTNKTVISGLLNLGITTNDGIVTKLTQQDSETYDKSKFVNNGSVTTATLEDGYFVENVLGEAPAGLTGYHTIMNGNEYYVNFNDAVDIANGSDSDATIKVLSTVDNRNNTIALNNAYGHSITVDLNGCNISSGEITTDGTVSFINSVGSNTKISEISAKLTNTGILTIGNYVKLSGESVNEEGAKTTVEPKASVTGNTTNRGDYVNDGSQTGVFTNEEPGQVENNGSMNNVIVDGGDFVNNKTVKTDVDLRKGTYSVDESASPQTPSNAVATSNTTPVTYYGSMQDLADDVNDPEKTSGFDEDNPLKVTILKDIDDKDDFGTEDDIVLSPSVPISINLNNHKIGNDGNSNGLTIESKESSGGSGSETTPTVSFENKPTDGSVADPTKAKVNSPVKVEKDTNVEIGGGISVDDVDNDGSLKLEEGSSIENLDNSGDTENRGTIKEVTQDKGSLTNDGGSVDSMTQSGGETTNDGGTIGSLDQTGGTTTNKGENSVIEKVNQTGGTTKNTDGAKIEELTQNGGNTENDEGSTIEKAEIKKGSYTGDEPEKTIVDGEEKEEVDPEEGKVAKIVTKDDDTIYFTDLDDALNYASNMSDSESPVTVTLIKDITSETVDVKPSKSPATKVTLDTNGHDIDSSSSIKLEDGTDLTITDTSDEKGTISAPVTNTDGSSLTVGPGTTMSGKVTNDEGSDLTITDGGKLTGGLDNSGTTVNDGSIEGGIKNTGDITNDGTITGGVTQDGGSLDNTGGTVDQVTLNKGSFEGSTPTNGITGGVAQTGSDENPKIYGDLQTAIDDANKSGSDTTIKITDDVDLSGATDPIVIDNENGKNITIDLGGNDITGGKIQVGDTDTTGGGSTESGKVTFTDTSTPTEENPNPKGSITSDIDVKETGDVTIDGGTKVTGDVNVDGGDVTVDGGTTIIGDVNVDDGGDVNVTGGSNLAGPVKVGENSDLKIDENSKVEGDITNDGNIQNDGNITGGLTNKGNVENDGNITGTVKQEDGSFTNGENGIVDKLEQTGGSFNNENEDKESIGDADISGGEFEGTEPDDISYDGAKVAVTTKDKDGKETTTYYPTLTDALNNLPGGSSDTTIKLLDDVTKDSGDADASGVNITNPNVKLDLNGHDVTVPVTVKEDAKNTTITDSSEAAGSGEGGKLTDITTDKGSSLTIDPTVSADKVENNGSLDNKGKVGDLTNNGDAKNEGSIDNVKQESGSLENDGTIEKADIDGGSYEGEEPTNEEESDTNAVAKIGDKRYASLDEAIKAANDAGSDVAIEIIKDTTLPENTTIGNGSGHKINLDLGGHNVDGGPLNVTGPGNTVITDTNSSGETGTGSLETDVNVSENGNLTIAENTTVDGDLTNAGTTINDGNITGDTSNSGNLTNGENAIIGGDVDNTGSLDNKGNLESDVINHGDGKVSNSGNLNGQLENKDNAKTENDGVINQIKQTGGEVVNKDGGSVGDVLETGGSLKNEPGASIDSLKSTGGTTENDGDITDATVSDLDDYSGNLPENGLDGIDASLTYTDENGKEQKKYYSSVEDALKDAATIAPAKLTVETDDAKITGDATVPEGVTLVVPEGKSLTVEEDASLTNKGAIDGEGDVTNKGNLLNDGSINTDLTQESGNLTNNNTIEKVTFDGGSYEGNDPTNEESKKALDEKTTATVTPSDGSGSKRYTTLEDAITDANNSDKDVTIEVNKDTTLPSNGTDGKPISIGNTNGNKVTLDLGGNKVSSEGDTPIKITGDTSITDSYTDPDTGETGKGSLDTNVEVDKDATLTVDPDTKISGEVDNSGKLVNKGEIDKVKQEEGATTENEGTIKDAEVEDIKDYSGNRPENGFPNAGGSVTYTKDGKTVTEYYESFEEAVKAAEENTPATVAIVTSPTTISETLTLPEGVTLSIPKNVQVTVEEGAAIKGNVTNDGTLTNNGTVDSVTNNGTLTNNGDISSVKSEDGMITNNSTIDKLDFTGGGYAGNEPTDESSKKALENNTVATDSDGNKYASLKDALDNASKTGSKEITLVKDETLKENTTVPEGMTVKVPEGTQLTVADNTILNVKGELNNDGSLVNDGTLTNSGSVKNDGTLTNNGNVINKGDLTNNKDASIVNKGDISNTTEDAKTTNKGNIANHGGGTINGSEKAKGTTTNEGSISGGSVNGPLDNTSSGSITNTDKISGEIKNQGTIKIPTTADTSGAKIDSSDGGSFEEYTPVNPVTPSSPSSGNNGSTVYPAAKTDSKDAEDTEDSADDKADIGADAADSATAAKKTSSSKTTDEEMLNNIKTKKASTLTTEEKKVLEQETVKFLENALSDAVSSNGTNGANSANSNIRFEGFIEFADVSTSMVVETASKKAAIISSILTTSEKQEVLNGASLLIRVETEVTEKEKLDEKQTKVITDTFPNVEKSSILNVNLYKKVGDSEEKLVLDNVDVEVSFEVPAGYTSDDGEMEFKILKMVEDKDGNITFEELDYTVEDGVVTMLMETTAEYVIVGGENLSSGSSDGTSEGELTITDDSDDDSDGSISALRVVEIIAAIAVAAGVILLIMSKLSANIIFSNDTKATRGRKKNSK